MTTVNRYEIVNKVLLLTHPRFDGKKFVKGMGITQACQEAWLSVMTFYRWLKEDETLNDVWTEGRSIQKKAMISKAMNNVESALYGDIKLRPKELVDVSLRFLEKTSDDFKDKVEVNGKVENEFSAPLEELILRATELWNKLKNQ